MYCQPGEEQNEDDYICELRARGYEITVAREKGVPVLMEIVSEGVQQILMPDGTTISDLEQMRDVCTSKKALFRYFPVEDRMDSIMAGLDRIL